MFSYLASNTLDASNKTATNKGNQMSELAIRFQELTETPATMQYNELIQIAADFRLSMDEALDLLAQWEKAAK